MKIQIIITLFLILITSFVQADEEDIPTVEYHICWGISDRPILEVDFTEVINTTKTIIEAHDLKINFDTGTESIFSCEFTLPDPLAKFSYYERVDSNGIIATRNIVIELSDSNLEQVSPIPHNDLSISISIWDDDAPETLATFLFYALGEIELAEERLLTLRDKTDNEILGQITEYYLGNIALINGDIELALEHYNNEYWLPTSGFHTFYGTNLAWALIQIGESEKAIEIMTEGVEQYKGIGLADYLNVLVDRAQIYALAFDYISAIADMDTAIEHTKAYNHTDAEIATLYKQRGDIIMLIYEWNRALEDYNIAIELDPDYAEAYYRRGILLYTMVERENAVADFETYLQLDTDGQFAESATEFIANIQTELDALGG